MTDLTERLRLAAKILRDVGGQSALAATVAEGAAALEAARESVWQPIETAPKDGTSVLLHYPESGAIEGSWYTPGYRGAMGRWEVTSISSHGCGCCSDHDDQPTHWRPLAAPPATEHAREKEVDHD